MAIRRIPAVEQKTFELRYDGGNRSGRICIIERNRGCQVTMMLEGGEVRWLISQLVPLTQRKDLSYHFKSISSNGALIFELLANEEGGLFGFQNFLARRKRELFSFLKGLVQVGGKPYFCSSIGFL
ncbi:hypothetical protein L1049_014103 [Liquidambar formosana]|uniref:Uncharacterized protein n=1 Tax=Liquidambar formosana TaxID=63359 RepID=A0AAP0RQB6_LIQFO